MKRIFQLIHTSAPRTVSWGVIFWSGGTGHRHRNDRHRQVGWHHSLHLLWHRYLLRRPWSDSKSVRLFHRTDICPFSLSDRRLDPVTLR
jgi:hypothetical protein